MRIITITIILLLSYVSVIFGDHISSGLNPGNSGPINTISATTLEKGKWAVSFRTDYLRFDAFSNEELAELVEQGLEVESTRYVLSPYLNVAYGVGDDLTLSASVPYVYRNGLKAGGPAEGGPEGEAHHPEADVHHHGSAGGVGDITVYTQYRFFRRGGSEVAVLGGIKTPTGRTRLEDDEGEVLEVEHQPGSGSWDPYLGMAFSRQVGRSRWDGNLLYQFVTSGTDNVNLGDVLQFNAAFSYGLSGGHPNDPDGLSRMDRLSLTFELNGEWRDHITKAGVVKENHGGTVLYLAPGLRWAIGEQWSVSGAVAIPVYQDWNGIQTNSSVRLITGIGFSL